jgi:hypothetical protein
MSNQIKLNELKKGFLMSLENSLDSGIKKQDLEPEIKTFLELIPEEKPTILSIFKKREPQSTEKIDNRVFKLN